MQVKMFLRSASVKVVAALLILTTLPGLAIATDASPAAAAASRLCNGYAACSTTPYTTHGYQNVSSTSYWGMDAGDECTNYAAFVESTVYGASRPDFTLGNGGDWAANAASHGVTVNSTPTVGSVAQWNGGDYGMTSDGHVAIVEEVGPDNSYIDVSQQNITTDTNGYDWEKIDAGASPNAWEPWPDNFIHFEQQGSGGGTPAPVITSVSPLGAPVGSQVTIQGSNLSGASSLSFGGKPSPLLSDSASTIYTDVPAGATTGSLTVTTGGGSASTAFSVIPDWQFRVDVNGDGKTDLIYIHPGDGTIWTFLSQGNGEYTAESATYGLDMGSGIWSSTGYSPVRPAAPTKVKAVPAASSVTLTWASPTTTAPISAYNITPLLNGNPQQTQTFVSSSPRETVQGLTPGNSYSFEVAAINQGGVGQVAMSSNVAVGNAPAITSQPSATFIEGNPSSFTAVATGDPVPKFSKNGALPLGVTFIGGVLSGTPKVAGTFPIVITATNGISPDAAQSFTLKVLAIGVTTSSLPAGKTGTKYSAALKASGGNPPYNWSLATGSKSLPPGLRLSSTGVLSGTPTKKGTYSFTVKVMGTKTKTKPVTVASVTKNLSIVIN